MKDILIHTPSNQEVIIIDHDEEKVTIKDKMLGNILFDRGVLIPYDYEEEFGASSIRPYAESDTGVEKINPLFKKAVEAIQVPKMAGGLSAYRWVSR